MTAEEMLRQIDSLPPEAQRQIEDFISYLRDYYRNARPDMRPASELESEGFVGMWRDREEMRDSSAWIDGIRQSHI